MYIQSITENEGLVAVTVSAGEGMCETHTLSVGRLKRLSSPLAVGMVVEESLYDELTHAAEVTSAVRMAAEILSNSDKSARALQKRLMEKGVKASPAADAVSFMVRKGYLNEFRQASAYAASAVRKKHYGQRRVTSELLAKGYGQEVIRRAIDEVPEEAWDDALSQYLEKQCRGKETSDPAVRRKLIAAAERMGYAPSAALAYIKKREKG